MTVLLEARFTRTLDAIVARHEAPEWPGMLVEAWVFEDRAARLAAEAVLRGRGFEARIRSAYKPLVHAFLEEIDMAGVTAVTIGLPPEEGARFRVEAFPLPGLLAPVPVSYVEGRTDEHYEVTLTRGGRDEYLYVFVPNRRREDPVGRAALSPTGWVRTFPPGCPVPNLNRAEVTDYELAFDAVIGAVKGHGWPGATPFFETLEIAVGIGGVERKLDWHDECLSTREGLHEDLYFSLLEVFQTIGGRPLGTRDFQPGQIVPLISSAAGQTTVRVSLVGHVPEVERGWEPERLELASRPLTVREIGAAMAHMGGVPFGATSVQGRAVLGVHVAGVEPGLVISSGQHANETSGPIGALRAAAQLRRRRGAHFALIAQENVDGYALHHRLRGENPRHMHHAARFTALGDDIEARAAEAPQIERAARLEALRRTEVRLHINLHGYPAHEWTRPLTGYLPGGAYAQYALPRGFFLILRHHAGLEEQAHAFMQALTARLIVDPALARLNAEQIAAYQAHLGPIGSPVYNGIICEIGENARQIPPFQLISEYPDETIYGDAFRLAHTTQMNTVLHAAELFLDQGMLA